MSGTYSSSDVASHNKADDLWIIVEGGVYDLTKFQTDHPGGKKSKLAFLMNRGQDSTLTPSSSPPESRRKGRFQAVLEIPQRGHPQEVAAKAPNRHSRRQRKVRDRSTSSSRQTSSST